MGEGVDKEMILKIIEGKGEDETSSDDEEGKGNEIMAVKP